MFLSFRHGKRAQTQTFVSDIFRWGRSLPREGVGPRKFDMSFETQGNQLFWRDIPGFCKCPKSLRKEVCVQFLAPSHVFLDFSGAVRPPGLGRAARQPLDPDLLHPHLRQPKTGMQKERTILKVRQQNGLYASYSQPSHPSATNLHVPQQMFISIHVGEWLWLKMHLSGYFGKDIIDVWLKVQSVKLLSLR